MIKKGKNKCTRLAFLFVLILSLCSISVIFASADEMILPQVTVVPTATEVAASGDRLRTSTLSGGVAIDPTTGEELEGKWAWTSSGTKVTESGYYEAYFKATDTEKYEPVFFTVYVRIVGDISDVKIVTTIVEAPTITNTLSVGDEWAEFIFEGGKTVGANGETVDGTFVINHTGTISTAGTRQVEFLFTPTDERYATATIKVNVIINAIPISFIDSEGNFVVDGFVFTAEPGVLMRDVLNGVKKYLNYPPQSVFVIEDSNYAAQNGRTYKLTVIHDNPNYTGSELYFTVVFKNVEVAPTIAFAGYNQYKVDCGRYSPAGTFTITCNGEEIAEAKAGQPFDCVVYTDEGGTYEITAKYNPTENDYFIVSDASYSITVNPARNIKTVSGMHFTVNGSQTYNAIRTGDVIELTYNMPEFAYYVVKDGSGKTVTLEGVDLASKKIKFTMPDFDLSFSVKTPAQLEQEEATANCDHLCHSDNQFIQLIWKLLHIIFRLFNVQQYCDCGITHYDAPIFG